MRLLILHGGVGSRLRPLTAELPKGCIPIRGKSAIERIYRQCQQVVSEAAIVVPSGDKNIAEQVHKLGLPLLIREAQQTPMQSMMSYLTERDDPVILWWGDTLLSLDVQEFATFHRQKKAGASMALWETTSLRELKHWGSVTLGNDARTIAHPVPDFAQSAFIKAGAFIFEPTMAKRIRQCAPADWNMSAILNALLLDKQFYGFVFTGYRRNINYGHELIWAARDMQKHEGAGPYFGPRFRAKGRTELGETLSVESDVTLEDGVHVSDSVLLSGVRVGKGATVVESVIGTDVAIEPGAFVYRKLVTKHGERPLEGAQY